MPWEIDLVITENNTPGRGRIEVIFPFLGSILLQPLPCQEDNSIVIWSHGMAALGKGVRSSLGARKSTDHTPLSIHAKRMIVDRRLLYCGSAICILLF